MKTSITDQTGGTAAETQKINSNPQPVAPIAMSHSNNNSITLKKAAAMFSCASSSLKNNIKSKKLAATKENEKDPYYVRPSDVERFLRATPGIVSIFHPDKGKLAATETGDPPSASKADSEQPHVVKAQTVESAEPTADAMKTASVTEATAADFKESASTQAADATKRRRRRHRGKGGAGSPTSNGIQAPVLKALAGTTPKERLRITACLTELLGLVALA